VRSFLRARGFLALLVLSWHVGASAQGGDEARLDVQNFLPPVAPGGTFTIARPEALPHLTLSTGLHVNYAQSLLVRGIDDQAIVSKRGQAELYLALGLFERLELGVALPAGFSEFAPEPAAVTLERESAVRLSDVRFSVKIPILFKPFRLSFIGLASAPTGGSAQFLGHDYWTFMPGLLAGKSLGRLHVFGHLGYRFRRREALLDLEIDDEMVVQAGARYQVKRALDLVLETQLKAGLSGRTVRKNEVPMDVHGGTRIHFGKGITLDVGAGTGVIAGYGTPTFRVFADLRYASEREPCAHGPEDFDGFQDADFCRDPDNDGDGIPDEKDECPNDPEDFDGFLDEDGCPDFDNDGDGIPDVIDRCPLEPEDADGFEDEDGCPDRDNDGDGIPDAIDECPMQPEDLDGYQDEDGCPEPGPSDAVITVTETRILISERIYFDYDADVIRSVSFPLLDQIAEVISALPEERVVRVEGFSDSDGNASYNLNLSWRRARSVVDYLVERGVPRARLRYEGYGSDSPVAPNDMKEGRALNRRVEFTIFDPSAEKKEPRSRRRRRQ
jgi:outer membrane protein OmpA-like peptidoglycan-associated protein